MLLETPLDLRRATAGRRLIGLDPGTKTIGVAVSDPGHVIATPRTVIRRRKLVLDLEQLRAIVAETGAGGFIIGLPLNMDGSKGPRVQSVRAFQRELAKVFDLPMAFADERLSTAAVERQLIANDVSRGRRAEVIDAHAAAYILQGVLDMRTD
ncbi:MAG: Holliday junction resolvase RuvX [Pseudomonadota bacterium]|nr:Holliday junction resolvase RuvX [Pseudomonadota bacterium]